VQHKRINIQHIYVVTTDTDAGAGIVRAVEANGFPDQIEVIDGFELIAELTS
jgi:predicted metal-dependent phosphoesterase TrpH